MEEQKIINLSFDEKKVSKKRIGNRTIVALTSYLKEEKLRMYFNYIGFRNIPDIVLEMLENGGYKYDYKLHGWKTNTSVSYAPSVHLLHKAAPVRLKKQEYQFLLL